MENEKKHYAYTLTNITNDFLKERGINLNAARAKLVEMRIDEWYKKALYPNVYRETILGEMKKNNSAGVVFLALMFLENYSIVRGWGSEERFRHDVFSVAELRIADLECDIAAIKLGISRPSGDTRIKEKVERELIVYKNLQQKLLEPAATTAKEIEK